MSGIGRIERVDLRQVWPHEAYDFTRWLGENLDILSEELGVVLADAETESTAGDFSVDVVAKDEADRTVVIENQLERSDHDHLGKLLTYFAMMNADAAVWIVSDARPEHVSAVSWLNENSEADFCLVQVEAIRIAESPPAPLLRRIVGPSPETREARRKKQEMSEGDTLRYQFWEELLDRAAGKTNLHASVSPSKGAWIATGGGVSGLLLSYVIAREWGRVELYIDRGQDSRDTNKSIFDQLHAAKDEIEADFTESLHWERLDDARACRISYRAKNGGYLSDREYWPGIQDAMIDAMIRLEKALRPHIDQLDM